MTSLHRAIWDYQKTAATSSDVDLAKKVNALSEQKIAAYEGRFGWVLRKVSALINWLKFGRAISCGELGLELSTPIIAADTWRQEEQQKRKECKAVAESDLRKTYKYEQSYFVNLVSSFFPVDKIEKWEDLSSGDNNHYCLTLSEPVLTLWVLDGIPKSVNFPKHLDLSIYEEGVLNIYPVAITSEENSWINSLRPTEDGKIEVNYTFNGKVKSAIVPFREFIGGSNRAELDLPAPPVVDPMDDKFFEQMIAEFRNVWTEVKDKDFVTRCWFQLLRGVKKGNFKVIETGKKYLLELDKPVTGTLAAAGISMPFFMNLDKKIEITITKDNYWGNYSFIFPQGGLSFEVKLRSYKLGSSIDRITVLTRTQEVVISTRPCKVTGALYYLLKALAPESMDGDLLDMTQKLPFQDALGKLDALNWEDEE